VTHSFRRALARLTTPTGYLLLLGTGQIAWLWTERLHFGNWVPLAATLGFIVLTIGLRLEGRWAAKYAAVIVLIGLMTIAPLVSTMISRTQLGLTFENDGLAKAEVATDRLLQGNEIYGINWQGTAVEGYSHIGNGREVRHFNHLPMTVLAAVPVRLLTRALGLPFDYRMVLILFVLVGMLAVSLLSIPFPARFLVACALLVSPALPVMTITGHDDIMYVVMIMAGTALLAHRRPWLACLAFGLSAAFKPFGALAIPLVLIVLWLTWRRRSVFPRREAALCLGALAAPAVLSIAPFLLWNAGAFWRDVVLFTNGGIPDAFPMSGFGLSGILVALGVLAPGGSFPFGVLQLGGMGAVYWMAWRRLAAPASLGRFMGLYVAAFLVFGFLARFFVDNYVAALLSFALCILPLGTAPLLSGRRLDPVDGDGAVLVDAA
jgi:glycosyl transferase family 87